MALCSSSLRVPRLDEEKLTRIERAGIRAVEIDLSALKVSPTPKGLRALRNTILNDCGIKRWLYPLMPVTVEAGQPASTDASALPPGVLTAPLPERIRFTIGGLWVDFRVLGFGSVVVKSVAYSPAIAELLKRLARRYSGRYVAEYKNWLFPAYVKEDLVEELQALADSEHPATALTVPLSIGPVAIDREGVDRDATGSCLDARVVLEQYRSGVAPECLPVGEFRARHFGPGHRLRCPGSFFFQMSGVQIVAVELIREAGRADFAYRLRRQ